MDAFFLHTFPSTIAFKLKYVLFYQFYAKIDFFFSVKKCGLAPTCDVDVETFGGKWNKKTDVKKDFMTSYIRGVLQSLV